MARKRKKQQIVAGELNLTAMIDVAFQLLNFFVLMAKPHDVVANLDVFTPSAEKSQQQNVVPPNLIKVIVFPDGYSMNDKPVSEEELDRLLAKLASLDPNQTIVIMCTALSLHKSLVHVLDLCAKSGLSNISILSTN